MIQIFVKFHCSGLRAPDPASRIRNVESALASRFFHLPERPGKSCQLLWD